MIGWLDAKQKIADGHAKVWGTPTTNDKVITGLTVLSHVASGFGYHYDTPDKTDHNWSGELGGGMAGSCSATADGQYLGTGKGYDGAGLCFVAFPDDDAGIVSFINRADYPAVESSLEEPMGNGDLVGFVTALFAQPVHASVETQAWADSIRQQFHDKESLGHAMIESFQKYENATGMTSGWHVNGKPVGEIQLTGENTAQGTGAASTNDTSSDNTGIYIAGAALVAVVAGVFYATRK